MLFFENYFQGIWKKKSSSKYFQLRLHEGCCHFCVLLFWHLCTNTSLSCSWEHPAIGTHRMLGFFLIGKNEILWKEYGLEFTLDCNCAISFQIRNKGIQAAGSQIRCHSCLFFLKVWGSSLTRHHQSYKWSTF